MMILVLSLDLLQANPGEETRRLSGESRLLIGALGPASMKPFFS
jgi:hypothetical protein